MSAGLFRVEAGFSVTALTSMRVIIDAVTVDIPAGRYSHTSHAPINDYLEFTAAVNAAIVLAGIADVTLSYDVNASRYSWARPVGGATVVCGADDPDAAIARFGLAIGFSTQPNVIGTATGDQTPYYIINGQLGGVADASGDYEEGSLTTQARTEDGSKYSVSREGAAILTDFTVQMEPRAAVYRRHATATEPWTWQDFYQHVRGEVPFLVTDECDRTVLTLEADSTNLRPRRVVANWDELWNLAFSTQVEGRLG